MNDLITPLLHYPTPPCPHCGQPMPLPLHICDAFAIAVGIPKGESKDGV